ncbi:hypothetical protein B0T20DRAFT_111012 [Sordaria brevicollis]|uniref:F-box domain-containing protein n=1 Tax=Sordaria brevicollis TaxID=83679 RepID=A0AAE0U0P2_SORBR|nr:hypothetical protein B0T20DRAFT_111012 [Sordaria brevicollis]
MARTKRSLFCNLCQAVIPRVGDNRDRADGEGRVRRLAWYRETRAVRAVRDTSSPFLTGVGFLDNDDVLEASHDPDVAYRLPVAHGGGGPRNHTILSESGTGQANSPKYLTFIFHDACWQLFLAGVLAGLPETVATYRTSQDQVRLVATALFTYLSCMPLTKLNQVVIRHELPPYRQAGVSLPDGYTPTDRAIMMADPSDIPTLDGLIQGVAGHEHGNYHYTISPHFNSTSSSDAFFSTLPEELIHQVLRLLPCPDVCNLRLASRSVASVSNPSQLPRSFWASRFEPENGMGFFFAGRPFPDSKTPIDYRTLHSALRLELSKVTEVMNLRNRRRIWRMLREMSRCVTLAIEHIWLSTNGDSDTGSSTVHIPEGHVAGRLVCPSPLRGGPVTKALQRSVGTTIFARQAAVLPDYSLHAPLCVGVSFVSVDRRPYVCGIRFLSAGLDGSCRVGVVIQETETIIALEPGDELAGFRVACLANGMVGLGLLVRPSANPDCTPMLHPATVGDLDTSTSGLGLANLTPINRGIPTGIIAGLDAACRIISLQLLESQSSVCKEKEQASIGPFAPRAALPRLQTVLWSPSIPRNADDIITPRPKPGIHGSVSVREEKDSDFVLNIPFGGENGERLKTLNRIVAYTDPFSEYGTFKGFGFFYDDEPAEVFYGTRREYASFPIVFRQCLQSSFAINGREGEVINHMELFGLVSDKYKLDAIKLTTNHGRSVQFKHESEGFLNTFSRPVVSPDLSILRPPAGSTIIGLYANTHVR